MGPAAVDAAVESDRVGETGLYVAAPAEDLEQVLDVRIDNAIRHAGRESALDVCWSGTVAVSVADEGSVSPTRTASAPAAGLAGQVVGLGWKPRSGLSIADQPRPGAASSSWGSTGSPRTARVISLTMGSFDYRYEGDRSQSV